MFESGIFWIILTLAFFADYQMTYNILCTDQDGVDVRYCKEGPSLTLQVLACLTAVIMIFYSMQVYRYRPKFKLSIKMVKATCKPLHKVKSLY